MLLCPNYSSLFACGGPWFSKPALPYKPERLAKYAVPELFVSKGTYPEWFVYSCSLVRIILVGCLGSESPTWVQRTQIFWLKFEEEQMCSNFLLTQNKKKQLKVF